MVKVRNRSLFILLLVAASLVPPAVAAPHPLWLAQLEVENPDAADNPDGSNESPGASETAPPELSPAFKAPEQLPQGSTLAIEGSSSMAIITRALVQKFQPAYPNAEVTLSENAPDVALANLQAGKIDLAAIGHFLSDEQKAQGLMAVPVSREKIALIVGAANSFDRQIEAEDFVRIFRGEITNWIDLGGADLPIRLVDRPETSDTRAALADYEIFGGDLTTGDNVTLVATDSTAEVVAALGDNGIGYAIASQVLDQENVRVLAMHGTLPDDPRYPYSQPRNYVYRTTDTLPVAAEAFLALATGAQGQAAVAAAKAAEAADVAAADLPDRVVAMRPNGQGFVTGDRTGTFNFWNLDGTVAGAPVPAHTGPVTALTFSPDGQRLISGGADGTLRFWDAVGAPIGEPINAGNGPVTSLITQADGSFLSASADGTLQQWDNLGNPLGAPITGHEDAVRDMALSPEGTTLVTAAKDGTIRRWRTTDGSPQGDPLTGHQGAVQALAMKPDGTFFSGGADGTVRRWDTNGTPIESPLQLPGPVNAIAINADGNSLAVGDDTGSLQYLSGEGVPVDAPMTDVGPSIDDLAFTPDGQRLVVSAGDSPQLRDSTGQIIPTPQPDGAIDDDSVNGIPPELLAFWQRIRQLPPRVLWMLPVLVLGILLLGLLRSFRQDEEDIMEAESEELLPGESGSPPEAATADDFSADDFSADDFTSETVSGFSSIETAGSPDASLAKAKQTLAEGVKLGNAGLYQAALDQFCKAIELADIERLKAAAAGTTLAGASAVIARGLARRGTALANLGRDDEALQSLNRSLGMEPDDAAAWIGKGNVLSQIGQLDEALFCFDKALELNPNLAAAWQGKGKALQKMGRDAEARNCFNQARSLGGINEDIPIELGTPVVTPPQSAYAETDWAQAAFVQSSAPLSIEPGPLPTSTPSIQPGPAPVKPASSSPPLVTRPMGSIGIVPSEPPTPPDAEIEIPPNLLMAIDSLSPEPKTPSSLDEPTPAVGSPLPIEPTAPLADTPESAVPAEVLQAVETLPSEAELPDPNTPTMAPVDIPPEVSAILAGDSDIPSATEPTDMETVSDPMATFLGNDPTVSMRPPARNDSPDTVVQSQGSSPSSNLGTAIRPDQPDDEELDLSGLPPEVLEALKGIPADSPDSFNLPPTKTSPSPPPPPSNPRLQDDSA